jgi:tetratricopeptide (TPR) repeat protein
MSVGRNDPCPCGSGKKYKKCCESRGRKAAPSAAEINLLAGLFDARRYVELEGRARLMAGRYPDSGLVWKILGAALQIQGKDSLAALRNAAERLPGDAVAHYNLGNVLYERGLLSEAEASFRRALRIGPKNADAHVNLGKTLQDMGRVEEAADCYRQAIRIRPDHAEAHNNLGEALMEAGQIGEAGASFRQSLRIRPDYLKVRLSLALAGKVKEGDDNLAALIEVHDVLRSGRISLPREEAICLHFALGKSYDDMGAHEKAFPHFREGNRLKRTVTAYNAERVARHFAAIVQHFDAATLERLRGGGDPSAAPIFVLGMPRSGTTLVEQIVSSYPGIHGAGELADLKRVIGRPLAGATFPDNLPSLDRAKLLEWGAEYIADVRRHAPEAVRIVDKMPANFLALGLIHLMLPNAKIIHVVRHPADTCLSCFTTLFKDGQAFSYDLAELGGYYSRYARLMEHWRRMLPEGAFLDVQYEDLVADQEAQSRRIIEYCGLDWNPACLDFQCNRRTVKTASMAQVRQPVYRSSVARWRPYEKFLQPLFEALGELAPPR